MLQFVDKIPYPTLIVITILLFSLPFYPMPHAIEKIIMLTKGQLKRPFDIFDLFMHTTPLIILIIKIICDFIKK